ncbi:MAG: AMP-binding protein [Erythrobacter sp.]|nr:AMP-binding protein [Erythrobacter sp.]
MSQLIDTSIDPFVAERLPDPAQWPRFLFDVPELHYPERLNAAVELLDRACEEGDGDRLAVINDAGTWTYRELADLSDKIAGLLVDDGKLRPGNRVLLRGPNSFTLIACWFAVLKAGGIAVTTMPMLRAGELAPILRTARISHALVDSRTLQDWRQAADGTDDLAWTATFEGDSGTGALESMIADRTGGFEAFIGPSDAPAVIAFTSGTTGVPKGCVHDHRALLAPADTFARHILKPEPGLRWCGSPPIAFTFGLGALVLFPFRFRGTSVTLEQASPANLLAAIERFGVNMLFTAPTAYKVMLPLLSEADISSLRACISAGEHLPLAIFEAWETATGHRLVNGIGATEMMHIFISAAGNDILPGATGKVVPGYEACVLDEQNNPMSEGEGRLAVRGPTGCRYLDDPRQENYVIGGWNVTGDTYRLDAEGYFHYVARSDDMIVSSGYNIAAPEVENALLSHGAVAECAVVGTPDDDRGMIVKAYVVCAQGCGDAALAKALQDHVKAAIAPYKYPRAIEFVPNLPKTLTGKVQRYRLREKEAS